MNNLDKQYTALLQDILDNGHQKGDRTGTGTISVFGRQIRHKMSEGFPILTTKKVAFRLVVIELLWFLRGETNIKYLIDNNCHIWDGDCYEKYLNTYRGNFEMDMHEFVEAIKMNPDFAEAYGNLGPVYGKQWRYWSRPTIQSGKLIPQHFDQIANAINDLRTNPDSRRIIVSAWNVGEIDQMTLPPCHNFFQFYTRELSFEERHMIWHDEGKEANVSPFMESQLSDMLDRENVPTRAISLMFNMRSTDVGLGLPFNIASYGLLLEIIAKEVNMVPDELIYTGGDVHLYLNHLEPIKEQLTRESFPLPKLVINDEFWNKETDFISNIPYFNIDDFYLDNYQSQPTIKLPLSN